MANRKDQHCILIVLEAVERDIAGTTAGYHQFAQRELDRTTDQRMASQQAHGFLDQFNRLKRRLRIGPDQEVGQPFEVRQRPSELAQLCQDLAFGLAGFLPAMRVFNQA